MAAERTMRRAQTISPSGVGAIIDVVGESFVAEDIGRWKGRELVRGSRIAARFNVSELRTPPAGGRGVPFYRFPRWLFCGRCRTMTFWSPSKEKAGQAPRCEKCPGRPAQLVPMRFIAVCGNGHLDDIDWWRWAHSGSRDREQQQCGSSDLLFRHVTGVGGGLESLEVRCGRCGAARDLHDLPAIGSLPRIGQRCPGRQPWQTRAETQDCEEQLVALQRGASSVYFPEVISAIDLPPESNWSSWGGPEGRIERNDNFKLLLSLPEHPLRDQLIDLIVNKEDVMAVDVRRVLNHKLGLVIAPEDSGMGVGDLPREEWLALTAPPDTYDPRDNFIARRTPFPSVRRAWLSGGDDHHAEAAHPGCRTCRPAPRGPRPQKLPPSHHEEASPGQTSAAEPISSPPLRSLERVSLFASTKSNLQVGVPMHVWPNDASGLATAWPPASAPGG